MIAEMDEQMQAVRKDIKAAQDRQKEYADTKRSDRTFKEWDKVSLRVRDQRRVPYHLVVTRSLAQGIVVLTKCLGALVSRPIGYDCLST